MCKTVLHYVSNLQNVIVFFDIYLHYYSSIFHYFVKMFGEGDDEMFSRFNTNDPLFPLNDVFLPSSSPLFPLSPSIESAQLLPLSPSIQDSEPRFRFDAPIEEQELENRNSNSVPSNTKSHGRWAFNALMKVEKRKIFTRRHFGTERRRRI